MFDDKAADLVLPKMILVRQLFEVPPPVDVVQEIDSQFANIKSYIKLEIGGKIAVGVGSRGIDQLPVIVRRIVEKLKESGFKPFILPAMGSHGAAVAEKQIEILKSRGITEQSCGAAVKANMDVVSVGHTPDGIPLFLSRLAYEADGIVIINRIKPHTNFIGPTESGLMKMMAIGLGNQIGAEHYHRASLVSGMKTVISSVGRQLIKAQKFLFGVGLVENQRHQICTLKLALKHEAEAVEAKLLSQARSLLPHLPVDEIDLLIVDEMGKNISGQGVDPNVVGRECVAYGVPRRKPRISRIFIRDLTDASNGAALGIATADFTLKRLVDKIDFEVTAVNCLTACCPEAGRVPLSFATDREAIAAALMSVRPYEVHDLGIVHIKNTLELDQVMVSESYGNQLMNNPAFEIESTNRYIRFDGQGMLRSPFQKDS